MTEPALSRQLVQLCARPVDADTRERAALHLLDWLACAIAGSQSPVGRQLAQFQTTVTESGVCFVAGGVPTGAATAAFVNGGLGNVYELDDVHRTAVLHAGDVVVPAALAVAQQQGSAYDQLLDAITCGYEVAIRIGLVAASGGYTSWYNSGTCGIFGGAMAAGMLLQLSEDKLVDALGQAGMSAAGIWQCRLEPTYSKQLACASAARNAVVAAQLASGYFPGAAEILEGELGFFHSFYPACDARAVMQSSDAGWKLHEVSFKPWPACRHVHPVIEAMLSLKAQIDTAAVEQIDVRTYQAAIDFCDNPRPASAHEARFSLQYCCALCCLYGAPEIAHFEPTVRSNRVIVELAARVTVQANAQFNEHFPHRYGAAVVVRLNDGRELQATVDSALGDPENPLSKSALMAKFNCLAHSAGIDQALARDLANCMSCLPSAATTAELNRLLKTLGSSLCAG